jgi:cytochrome P450
MHNAINDLDASYLETSDIEPFGFYDSVHKHGGIVWDERMGSWIVTGYDLVQAVLRDDVTFSHPYVSMQAGDAYLKIRSGNKRSMQFLTGDRHRAFHKWWLVDLLSPRAVKQYRPLMVDNWVGALLDRLEGLESFDFVTEFAERVPMGVFAALLDLPRRDLPYLDHIKQLNDAIARFASVANSLQLEGNASAEARDITDRAVAAGDELNGILAPLVEARRDGKADDFISRLWAGGTQVFEDWNALDTLDACRRLLFAGVDTTTHAICNAYYMLLSDRGLFERIQNGGPELIDRFVEEVFRLNGSVQFRPRRVNADTLLGGVTVRTGDMLTVSLIGANRDPDHYACPHAIDLERARPHDHFAFNYGARTCLGIHLARAELNAAITQGVARFPRMALDSAYPVPTFEGFLMRSYRPLHVIADSGRPA